MKKSDEDKDLYSSRVMKALVYITDFWCRTPVLKSFYRILLFVIMVIEGTVIIGSDSLLAVLIGMVVYVFAFLLFMLTFDWE